MRELEGKFGKPHPALEGFKEPPPQFSWLVDSFFRLHRRRQLYEGGYQPIKFGDMADFAKLILRLPQDLLPLFYRAIEEADNAVLYDHYTKSREEAEKAAAQRKTSRKNRR
jgi:hypothetical protein